MQQFLLAHLFSADALKKVQWDCKPTQNGYIERFNRSYREDVLDTHIFENINQVRLITDQWIEDYNENHPHSSLGNMSPNEFQKIKAINKLSNLAL